MQASVTYQFASGTSYGITVSAVGSTIKVSVNNVQQISYSNATSNQTATKVGLRLGAVGSVTPCSWANFLVIVANAQHLWAQHDADYNVTAILNSSGSVVERTSQEDTRNWGHSYMRQSIYESPDYP